MTERAAALGGVPAGLTGQPAGVLTEALHATFAAQAGIALLGAAAALFVIGRGPRRERLVQRVRETDQVPAMRAAA